MLCRLIAKQLSVIKRQFFLNFTTNSADYISSIIPYIAISIPLFNGKYDKINETELPKLISNNAFFTMYLVNCFTRIIDISTNLPIFWGTLRRVKELNSWFIENNKNEDDKFECLNKENNDVPIFQDRLSIDFYYFKLTDITIDTPLKQSIVKKLNLTLKPGVNLIITGQNGVGKTSILRCIKNIWPISNGCIDRNLQLDNPSSVMFLSNKPVLTNGPVAEVKHFLENIFWFN